MIELFALIYEIHLILVVQMIRKSVNPIFVVAVKSLFIGGLKFIESNAD